MKKINGPTVPIQVVIVIVSFTILAVVLLMFFTLGKGTTNTTTEKPAVVEDVQDPYPLVRTMNCPVVGYEASYKYAYLNVNCQGIIIKIDDYKILTKYLNNLLIENKRPEMLCEVRLTYVNSKNEFTKCKLPE